MSSGFPFTFRLPKRIKQRLYDLKKKSNKPMRKLVLEALQRWIETNLDDPRSGSEPFDDRAAQHPTPQETLQITIPAKLKADLERAAEERKNHNPHLYPDSINAIANRALKEQLFPENGAG